MQLDLLRREVEREKAASLALRVELEKLKPVTSKPSGHAV